MAAVVAILWMGVSLLLVFNVRCEDNIPTVIERIDGLHEAVIQIQKDLPGVEEKVLHRIASTKLSLKSDLKQNIQQIVRDAMLEILQGESVEEMVRSQVVTEVRQLKQSHEDVKRELSHLQTLVNNKKQNNTEIHVETYSRSVESLKSDLEQCNQQSVQKDEDIADLRQCFLKLNQTCQLRRTEDVSTLTTSTSTTVTTPTSTSTTVTTPTSTSTTVTTPTSTSTTVTTPTTTTPNPNARNRIILAPVYSTVRHQFREMDIVTRDNTTYGLRALRYITTVSYMSKLNKLLIGRRHPHIIVSSDLDSDNITEILTGVISYGMAVDDELGIIFMTTDAPKKTISRMTTEGEDFTTVRDVTYEGSYPRAIAINPKEKLIYACNHRKVFVVSYDGTNLQTVSRGFDMFALTLDDTGSVLYFNDRKKLMKMSLPGNKSEEVISTGIYPWTMTYYNHRVYYTSCCGLEGTLGTVDVGSDPVSLHTSPVSMERTRKFAVCLVP